MFEVFLNDSSIHECATWIGLEIQEERRGTSLGKYGRME